MTATLLLDLDDTLLENDINTFLPAYIKAFSKFMETKVAPDQFIAALMTGTRYMSDNNRPDRTLRQVFEDYFYPSLTLSRSEFLPLAEKFYKEIFPELKGLTQPKPGAVEFVQEALQRGYQLAIATNPLFPQTANLQRLSWAGLPADVYNFKLISCNETFHFAKPNPAYFAELLSHLGWPEGPVVMVGDDPERDIYPARQIGMAAFWISDRMPTGAEQIASAYGNPCDILPWLDQAADDQLTLDFNAVPLSLAILRASPAVFDCIGAELPEACWKERPEPQEWSAVEILSHLSDVDKEVNIPRIQQVLTESNPFLPAKDTDRWAEQRNYLQRDGEQALHDFITARTQLLSLVDDLPPQSWQRPARHAIFGPTDLRELTGFMNGHDRLHVRQFVRTIQMLKVKLPSC